MKKLFWALAIAALFFLAAFAHAQVADIAIHLSTSRTLDLSANQYAAVPTCSAAAGCQSQLEICQWNVKTNAADSSHCIFIPAGWEPEMWIGISEAVTTPATATAPAQTSITPYQIGRVELQVDRGTVKQTP